MLSARADVADRAACRCDRHRAIGGRYRANACGCSRLRSVRWSIVGGSRWDSDACAALAALSESTGLAVACAFRRQDLFDNRHPHYAGDVGIGINPRLAARVRDADVLLVIGERLGEMTTSGYTLLDAPSPRQS